MTLDIWNAAHLLLDERARKLAEQARLLRDDLAACITADGAVGTAMDLARVRRDLLLIEEARSALDAADPRLR